jgi:O-antigen ligase
MKKLFNIIRIIFNDIRKGNRVTTFFFLLSLYYIINLLTSPITSGMSGGLEAEHNIFNQLTAGIFVLFVLYYAIVTKANHSYSLTKVLAVFLFYITLRTYMGFAIDNSRHTIFSFSSIFNMCFWAGSLIFGLKCFRLIPSELLKRMVKMVLTAYLIYVTYRLFTQKALLMRLGISMGINMAASVYMIIPLIFLVFKGKLRTFLLLLCCFICLYSAKRQAVAGLAIVLIFSLKTIYQLYFQKRKFLAFIIVVPLILVSSNFVMRISKDLLSRQELLEEREDTDSGRLQLWAVAMSGFQNSDNMTQWFGGGPGTGRRYIGAFFPIARAPHNGFIQVLCDYGFIGLILYGLFFVLLLGYVLKVRGVDNKFHYLSICVSWIFANTISHPGNLAFVFLAIGVGYIFYMQDYEKSKLLSGGPTATS